MNDSTNAQPAQPRRPIRPKIILIIVIAAAVWCLFLAWRILDVGGYFEPRLVGDGTRLETYPFDLSTSLIDAQRITPHLAVDAIIALDEPDVVAADEVPLINEEQRGKFLVDDDVVIGVTLGGESRAYPIRIMNWHEVVNDTLGGRPMAVAYHPLCDSIVVFDRQAGGETVRFGVSGLLYNSHHLLYDHREDPAAMSLWLPLQFRAVTGPAAAEGVRLQIIPMTLTSWGDWRAAHPQTTVLRGIPQFKNYRRRYALNTYGVYFEQGSVRFPVKPLPPVDGRDDASTPQLFTRIWADRSGAVPIPAGTARAETAAWLAEAGHVKADHAPADRPRGGLAEGYAHALWFAWYAMQSSEHLEARMGSRPQPMSAGD
jgi:hypothetical protein